MVTHILHVQKLYICPMTFAEKQTIIYTQKS